MVSPAGDHNPSILSQFQQIPVVVWAYGVFSFLHLLWIGFSVRKQVGHHVRIEPPPFGVIHAAADRRVVIGLVRC